MKKLLIVDDDVAVTNFLMVFLMQSGDFETLVVNDSRTVPGLLEKQKFEAILLDMDMPGLSGLDICKIVHDRGLTTPVIILTGVNDVDMAVRALKLGAFDYLTKPVDDNYLLEVIYKAIEHSGKPTPPETAPVHQRQEELTDMEAYEILPPRHPSMVRLFDQVARFGPLDQPVFIVGERGSGKKATARAIHKASPRKEGPFVTVDIAAQDPERFPVDFFGQAKDWRGERESRPGILEASHGGTLCISNFDRLPMPAQVRLTQAVEEGKFYRQGSTRSETIDMRLIAASRYDLSAPEFSSRFSSSLLMHLTPNIMRLPALRDRPDDIAHITRRFIETEARRMGRPITDIDPALIELFKVYPFPGNLQELRDIVSTSVMRTTSGVIKLDDLSPYVRDRMFENAPAARFEPRPLADIAKEHVARTLAHFNGDREKAGEALRISLDRLEEILSS